MGGHHSAFSSSCQSIINDSTKYVHWDAQTSISGNVVIFFQVQYIPSYYL
jgi:hypothetical protein